MVCAASAQPFLRRAIVCIPRSVNWVRCGLAWPSLSASAGRGRALSLGEGLVHACDCDSMQALKTPKGPIRTPWLSRHPLRPEAYLPLRLDCLAAAGDLSQSITRPYRRDNYASGALAARGAPDPWLVDLTQQEITERRSSTARSIFCISGLIHRGRDRFGLAWMCQGFEGQMFRGRWC